jgi:RNA polymerase-binding transcription factor DksA
MNDIRVRLDQKLKSAVSQLHQLHGSGAAVVDNGLFSNKLEKIRRGGFDMRGQLLERVDRLSAAIDRMSEGEYGLCEECGAPISLARLDVMPEVPTCVSCDDGGGRHGL